MAEACAPLQRRRGSLTEALPQRRTRRSYPELQAVGAPRVPAGPWGAPGPGTLPQESL